MCRDWLRWDNSIQFYLICNFQKVGDDWNSLDQLFDLDGLIGFNATGAGPSSHGNVQVQQPKPKKGPLEEKKK
jgi:hypothetical protein